MTLLLCFVPSVAVERGADFCFAPPNLDTMAFFFNFEKERIEICLEGSKCKSGDMDG